MDQFTNEFITSCIIVIPKEKTEKKESPTDRDENEADARFLTAFFE
jgi:hypothetical protein